MIYYDAEQDFLNNKKTLFVDIHRFKIEKMIKSIINSFSLAIELLFVITGVCTLVLPTKDYNFHTLLYGIPFIASGISDIILAIRHFRIFHQWGWYAVFGSITIATGCCLINLTDSGLLFGIGVFSLFRLVVLIGLGADIRKYGLELYWKYIVITGICGIILSGLLTLETSERLITGLIFITIGVTSVLLTKSLHKVIHYYKLFMRF